MQDNKNSPAAPGPGKSALQDHQSTTGTSGATSSTNHDGYWQANIRLMLKLLAVWFIVSFGFGIILVDWLNQFQFFGFKLGFWWAQQGSIYVFVVLIFIYTIRMKAIDKRYGVSDDEDER